jgi:hypothetical protein
MNRCTITMAGALALAAAASFAAAPAAAPAAAQPAVHEKTEPAIRTTFENGEPIDDFFTALAVRFDVMVVQPQPVEAFILRRFELPATLQEALAIARQTLEPQGFSILQSLADKRLVIRIVTTKEAKKAELAESPVSYGTAGEKIDTSDPRRQVTHLLPISHTDMIDSLRRTAMQDPEVSAEIAGGTAIGANLILTGPALKVQRAVETVVKLDKPVGGPIVARTLALQHLDAETTAHALNAGFAQGTAPMKAVVDLRTNSIVITGPEDRVLEIMVTLVVQDAKRGPILPPRSIPAFTQPALPATQPAVNKPGANGGVSKPGRETLDEMALGGDNPGFHAGSDECASRGRFSPFVNKEAFS